MTTTIESGQRRLPTDTVRHLLTLRDLTDPGHGPHAIQLVIELIERALAEHTGIPVHRHRTNPVVPVADNYDRLGYPTDAVARDARYTRYLSDEVMLRAHTSAAMPWLHERIADGDLHPGEPDLILSVPGLCYRRDVVDRHHVGEPHQHDLWRLRRSGPPLTEADLEAYLRTGVAAVLPGRRIRTTPAEHPYTRAGREIEVADGDDWIEVGECGLTDPDLLARCGLPAEASGLAMGLGLDRLTMLAKGIDDIRLLRAADPRIATQLLDLSPYTPVSAMPPVTRDLSVAVPPELDDDELVGDRVRGALGDDISSLESVEVVSRTPVAALPVRARERLGASDGQRNLLVRVVLRDLERTLTAEEGNILRDRVYAALHHGGVASWAAGGPPG
jgi:phenylalanyl-tRNA synthetase alpha chain